MPASIVLPAVSDEVDEVDSRPMSDREHLATELRRGRGMIVTVYNEGDAPGAFQVDVTTLSGDDWSEVLEQFVGRWALVDGRRYVLVANNAEYGDHVRIVTAREQAPFVLEAS